MEMMNSRWVGTVASIWIQLSVGASYVFGVYSPVLKSSQGYDQSTLDSVAVAKDIGANFGLLSGFLYSAVVFTSSTSATSSASSLWFKRKIGGPWIVITAGAIQCFIGYFFMWLAVTGIIPRPPVPLMCLFMFLAAHAQTFFNTANVVTGVQNFPDYKGTIVGIIKGFLGLSGAILIQAYQTIFVDKPSSFLLMLALLPTIIPLLLMFFIRTSDNPPSPTKSFISTEKDSLNGFSVIALLLALYVMILIISQNVVTYGINTRIITFTILLIGILSPSFIAFRAHLTDSKSQYSSIDDALLINEENRESVLTGNDDNKREIMLLDEKVPHLNLWQALQTVNFWLLFSAMACGLGSGMATVNNISQIGGSLGYTSVETRTLVSLWSIWNFLGRFGAGFISDYFLHLKGWARPIFMVVTLAGMGLGHLVIASGLPGALYAGSTVMGIFYGSQWSLFPTISSEIFGVTHLGTIFNTVALASPVGSYILSVKLVGFIYDKESSLNTSGHVSCVGSHCFMVSFIIMAGVCVLGCGLALILFFRTRRFYQDVIYKRVKH
ncbi:hypothetical protein MKW98_028678 [Papaver atlanticum]|uniref:Nodulin-like domain-containing protein n=1 Tax=Papaver atlanticum TaxID=357466 RepID=A0AAD4S512_9MAGN|nr:hypothetical protein MKW98_028678 [Papaver atlanticum]